MIYDCFCFNNELDILDLRFKILSPVVDYFVIAEANLTHSGNPKPMVFLENQQRWQDISSKIIHVTVTFPVKDENNKWDFSYAPVTWARENKQRNELINGLSSAADNDVIMLSDLDEIPPPELAAQPLTQDLRIFNQKLFCYYLNLVGENPWKGTRVFKKSFLSTNTLQKIRLTNAGEIIDGGWHFSYQGGEDQVHYKFNSSPLTALNSSMYHSGLPDNMKKFKSITDPNSKYTLVDKTSDLPQYVKDNWDDYVSKGFIINP